MTITQIKWIILIAHSVFWAVVAIRIFVSYYRNWRFVKPAPREQKDRESSGTKFSTLLGIIIFSGFTILYYFFVVLWWFDPSWAGSFILPQTRIVHVIGIICIGIGISFMVWAYLYLSSFRLMAKIEAGHKLCTSGPYRFLRHPIYTAISLFDIGCFLLLPTVPFFIITAGLITGSILRAFSEEKALMEFFGEPYHEYINKTYRFIPFVY